PEPLLLAAGVKRKRPAAISAAEIVCPAETVTPLFVRAPAAGTDEILTAVSALPSASLKPKSAAPSTYGVSSSVVTVWLTPDGASFTEVTLTLIVRTIGSRETPPFAVPPSSRTWKPKAA